MIVFLAYIKVQITGFKFVGINFLQKSIEKKQFILYNNIVQNIGVSPSGKASDSDSDIPVFESQYPSQIFPIPQKFANTKNIWYNRDS